MKLKPAITGSKRTTLALVFFIMLMDVVGLSMFFPIAPFIVGQYSSEAIMVTLLSAIFSAAQFIAAPILGRLSDRFGRKPVLLVSLAGSIVGYIVFGVARSLGVLFLSRMISGFAGGNMSTASAVIADVSKPHERAKNFTLVGLAWGIGLVAGPALGSAISTLGLNAPAFLAAALMALSLLAGFFLLPETLSKEHKDTGALTAAAFNPLGPIGRILCKPMAFWVLLVMSVFNLAANGVNSVGSVYMIRRFLSDQGQVTLLMVLGGIAVSIVQIFLVPVFVPRIGERRVAAVSLAGLAVCSAAIFINPYLAGFFVFYVLMSGIGGLVYPSMTTLATATVEAREMGSLMGVMTALGSLMNIFGPLWAGYAFDAIAPQAPYAIGAWLLAIAFTLMLVRRLPPAGSKAVPQAQSGGSHG